MSAEATGWAFRWSPYTGDRFIVHLAIADATDDMNENTFRLTVAALAKKARCSERTVQYALRTLQADGYLTQLQAAPGTPGTGNLWRFEFPAGRVQDLHPSERVQTQEHESSALVVPEETQELAVAPVAVAPVRRPAPRPVKASSEPGPRRGTPNPIWDAVVAVCHLDASRMTVSERGHVGKVVRELKEVGATADEIRSFARWWATEYRGARLTPPTITKHWSARGSVSGVTAAPDYNPATAWMYQ